MTTISLGSDKLLEAKKVASYQTRQDTQSILMIFHPNNQVLIFLSCDNSRCFYVSVDVVNCDYNILTFYLS